MMKKPALLPLLLLLIITQTACAQLLNGKSHFTHADTLRGTITPQRVWWNVLHYDVQVKPDFRTKSIQGKTSIRFSIVQNQHPNEMQIDLQQPLQIDSIYYNTQLIEYTSKNVLRDGNAYFITVPSTGKGATQTLTIVYHGQPLEATKPPWDGGWIWKRDAAGRPWMSVACQGLGASVWYPCKDHQSDEPDSGATLTIIVPDTLVAVGNGRLVNSSKSNGEAIYTWAVTNPINNYDLIPYIGVYKNFSETFTGTKGSLDCSYWVLDYDLDKAKAQFRQVPLMLKAFEYWFGPYPFYKDGYKLVEAPHLGMEHQSAVAYGNQFKNGYLGQDRSATGWGLKWDYIIVHESGHEWFGNNITSKDIADMWVHEGFTNYSEVLFTQYYYGKQAADAYVQGLRRHIQNDRPIIGNYGVNQEGSTDMYDKGANLIHTLRQVINNDTLFRNILRGLNQTFYHQTVTSKQVENYISQQSGNDFSKVFDQYLRTVQIPVLQLHTEGNTLQYRWQNVIAGFNLPVKLTNGQWITPTQTWQSITLQHPPAATISADPNFYITVQQQ